MNPSRIALVGALRQDGDQAAATLVAVDGSAPLGVGATMLVDADGSIEGSITGGCVEAAVAEEARAVLAGDPPRILTYGISDELAGTVGLTCGGTVTILLRRLDPEARGVLLAVEQARADGVPVTMATVLDGPAAGGTVAEIGGVRHGGLGLAPRLDDHVLVDARSQRSSGTTVLRHYGADGTRSAQDLRVFVQTWAPAPRMLLFGANDYSAALAPVARDLGYVVTLSDARERFVRSPRYREAARVEVGWPQELFAKVELGPADAVVVLTHDPKFDEPAILGALSAGVGYVGALGSRRTTRERNARLRQGGLPDDQLARIHSPCGLDVGAATPAEVAVAIAAEILAARSGRAGAPLRDTAGPIRSPAGSAPSDAPGVPHVDPPSPNPAATDGRPEGASGMSSSRDRT